MTKVDIARRAAFEAIIDMDMGGDSFCEASRCCAVYGEACREEGIEEGARLERAWAKVVLLGMVPSGAYRDTFAIALETILSHDEVKP
jgi:hypothetical protein